MLDYIAIDFETANYYRNSACQVGLVRFEDGKEVDSLVSLIRPAKMYFVPEFTQDIHGIGYNDVRGKPFFPEIWDSLVMPFIMKKPVPLVAHNAPFDMNVIRECCSYYGMDIPDFEYFDTLPLSKSVWPDLESYRLTCLGERFGIEYKAHDALDDSRTCGKLVAMAAEEFQAGSLEELLKAAGTKMNRLCE